MKAVLIVNLGTPDAPTPKAVKRFLAEFLTDRRVIKLTPWLWWPILHAIVLPLRSKRVAKLYQSIWTPQGSPLKVYTELQAKALQAHYAMRYGSPSIPSVLKKMADQGVNELTVLPLYPQFSHTTVSSVRDVVEKTAQRLGISSVTFISPYYDHPLYIQALVNSVKEHWAQHGRGERLLFSFHGLPQEYVDAGDPYPVHCMATATAVALALELKPQDYQIAYQSRFGPKAWIGPYTDQVLKEWTEQGMQRIDAISPSFAADCLETLEELVTAGGENMRYIPALNDRADHIDMLKTILNTSL